MSINNEIENRKIIDLYFNQHKTIREVCKILGKSSRYVVPIIKERRLRLADNPEQEKELPEVRAYKLFAERKSPKEVVTELTFRDQQYNSTIFNTGSWKICMSSMKSIMK